MMKCSHTLVLVMLFLSLVQGATAQSPNKYGWVYQAFPTGYGWVVPRASPVASLTQAIGVTEVMIRYSRPAVNGRAVWGELVPYEAVWRAGANEATVISFSTDVLIEKQPLAAGTYALFVVPTADGRWTFIFSNRPRQWGAFTYTPEEEVLRVTVGSQAGGHQERLQYGFPEVTDSTAQVLLHWAERKASFTITVDTPAQAAALADRTFDWRAGFFAADYFFQQGIHLEDALKWADASIAVTENASNVLLRARILAALGRHEEAIETAQRVLDIGPEHLQASAREAIQTWQNQMRQP